MTERRLRVALDARALQDRPLGGVGRGLASLLPRLVDAVDLVLLTDARLPPAATEEPQRALRAPLSSRGAAWLQLAAPRFLRGFDGLFHCPLYGLPYRQPVPMVVTIHDLTFEDHPEWFPVARRTALQLQGRHAARTARRIITDSDAVRQRVLERYQVDEARVVVIPFAVDPSFSTPRNGEADRARVAAMGIARPFVVALGGAARRQPAVAISAWCASSARADVDLVLVGTAPGGHEPGLHRVGGVDDAAWSALLAQASAFCYPTLYEGYGLPAIEAAELGTPIVCAPVGSLPEVLGPAAEWCEAPTTAAIAAGLDRVLLDAVRADQLRALGRARSAQHPGWDEVAERLVATYRQAWDG